jgi:hypothetical protein
MNKQYLIRKATLIEKHIKDLQKHGVTVDLVDNECICFNTKETYEHNKKQFKKADKESISCAYTGKTIWNPEDLKYDFKIYVL